jgi:hypothetical protein
VAVVLLAAGGGAFWFVSQRGEPTDQASAMERGPSVGTAEPNKGNPEGGPRPTATRAPEPTTAPAPTAASSSPAPTNGPTDEEQAVGNLETQRAFDAARVPLDGRWVAQVASKYVGISDPLQTAANGSHTFYAVDIWLESRAALNKVADPSQVYLLSGTDFGRTSTGPGGVPFWITLIDGGFRSEADVNAWCATAYPELTSEQLANTCAARTLSPAHP